MPLLDPATRARRPLIPRSMSVPFETPRIRIAVFSQNYYTQCKYMQSQAAQPMDPAAEVSPRAWELISSLLFDTEGLVDPYDIYRQLHAIGDDFLTPNGTHIVIGYKALANMVRGPKFRKNNAHVPSQKTQPFSL